MPDRPDDGDARAAALAAALGAVRARVADACVAVGREPREVGVVAVTKTYPASDVAALARLGMLDVGESKEQEAQAKRAELREWRPEPADVRWHLLGRIQSNKARAIGAFAHAVHSVDRLKLVPRLAEGAAERAEPVEVYLQVSLDGDPERGGAAAADLAGLADAVADHPELRLRGLMAVPPIGSDAGEQFARLRELGDGLRADHPEADGLSAGMSGDLEAAIANGSTLVRVGTALLGRRGQIFS